MKLGKWVPKELTESNKINRMVACSVLTRRLFDFKKENLFFNRLITRDDKWIRYENPNNSHEWLDPSENPSPRISKPLHPKKKLLCVWWDVQGVIYSEVLMMAIH